MVMIGRPSLTIRGDARIDVMNHERNNKLVGIIDKGAMSVAMPSWTPPDATARAKPGRDAFSDEGLRIEEFVCNLQPGEIRQ